VRKRAPSSTSSAKPRAQPPERRAAARVAPLRSARILDISPSGIAIETGAALQPGRVYDLILRLDEHRMPVAAKVLRLRRSGAVLRASLAFERILESDRRQLEQALVREVAERMTVIVR
jgi:hypothetical protein